MLIDRGDSGSSSPSFAAMNDSTVSTVILSSGSSPKQSIKPPLRLSRQR